MMREESLNPRLVLLAAPLYRGKNKLSGDFAEGVIAIIHKARMSQEAWLPKVEKTQKKMNKELLLKKSLKFSWIYDRENSMLRP